jgi:type IV pilus assembly protein PilM
MSVLASWLASPPPDAAIEIAPERVAAAVVSTRGGRLVVTAHAVEPVPAGAIVPSLAATNITDRALVKGTVRQVLDRLGVRANRVALVLPDNVARVSLIRFDQIPERREDLEQLVRWQIRKSAPFPLEEASVSYTAGSRADGGREFVVALARSSVVHEYESICQEAGTYAGLVDLATLSLLNLFLAAPTVPSGDWLLVHVRSEYTSIAIVRGEDVIFFRNRPEGDESSLADVVHQTAMYYEDRLSGRGFAHVLVAGGGHAERRLDYVRRSLEERLGVPVESVDPTRAAALTDRIAVSNDLLDVLGPLVGMLQRTRREAVKA